MRPIAIIRTGFPTKFGIPRQSGLVSSLKGTVVFNPEFRNPDALRGLEGFSHIWLIWKFSESVCREWSPTVRPPRLGGNTRVGVFASRSPFRPNPIGLSCVVLEKIELTTREGPVLHVRGVDMMDGTPIYDIKPYIPYTDSYPDAATGFTADIPMCYRNVIIPDDILERIPEDKLEEIKNVLAEDPRPQYQNDPERQYGFWIEEYEVTFRVPNPDTIAVIDITREK
ncbi:MAG: tRNA (N6-threonylcarbamoyladenosine(37)-N6)-methyltransferase TrmO [Bacteroidaceae bacterium]|jgi:tRNA-Thr(GGU) m(6)t(6)A37 methyltransferase TsaA|nr:tRNA (N6-threonylcarbamoyladenosine(37)-N6)-methyltransferase TrmO [Bacteroidales bacterium]HBA13135.1 tRNA (N6-threonylcarbamoyladenosine(37)-N6)-methyltransferase TrmO [Bacteroidales bacterium]